MATFRSFGAIISSLCVASCAMARRWSFSSISRRLPLRVRSFVRYLAAIMLTAELSCTPSPPMPLPYIYIIPHTLPMTTDVAEAKPFEMSVEVLHGAEQAYRKRVEVNQWSGENLEIFI